MHSIKLSSLLLGVSIASVGIIGLILFYRKKKSKSIEQEPKHKSVIYIPNSCVPFIFGKYGCVLKVLQKKCSTRFSFTPPGLLADETKCVIKGDQENVELAESIISSIVQIFRHESSTGVDIEGILNRHEIPDDSGVSLDQKEILTEILKLLSTNNKANETTEHNAVVPDLQYDLVQHISDYKDRTQKLVSIGGDKRIPVYVSSVAYPSQFWVQALGTKEHSELDQMTQDIYDYFDYNPECNFPPSYETVKIGNLYAALIEGNKNWYRVEVVAVTPKDEENPLSTCIDLYFLDYGYSLFTPLKDIRILPIKYFELNFQAIECCAANIKANDKDWSEEAIEQFEHLTHAGMWYKLHAVIESVLEDQGTMNPVPCVTLIDSSNNDLNINDEMVATGFSQYSV
ncbi:tudor and KH domain-containing protein homolog [Planococcus citri]|uniref:tudor and KH domain-containing protein homolog n=1 Tax=Planococcus citri TaxID=170843 RepID=UPI0031F993FF